MMKLLYFFPCSQHIFNGLIAFLLCSCFKVFKLHLYKKMLDNTWTEVRYTLQNCACFFFRQKKCPYHLYLWSPHILKLCFMVQEHIVDWLCSQVFLNLTKLCEEFSGTWAVLCSRRSYKEEKNFCFTVQFGLNDPLNYWIQCLSLSLIFLYKCMWTSCLNTWGV